MLQERPDHSLQATALVHEVFFLRLAGDAVDQHWENRGHFFGAAAEAMRRILIDSARRRLADKRHTKGVQEEIDDSVAIALENVDQDLLLDVDQGIERLAKEDGLAAELIKLRIFAGLSVTEAGEILELSRSNAYRIWEYARSWFAVHYQN